MKYIMLKSKIHGCVVTESKLDYEGSITIDRELMDKAKLFPYEKVLVLDLTNGNRFETYVIEGERNSGVICVNGAAARLVYPGDKLIILSFAILDENELADYKPIIIITNENNRVIQ
ncbi:MAG: aspartate 1-decarboxylase [Candidatus Marinimicrobia bacterium]|nr:aspartate 1-decarboxylase [Candidatus Neomarinimicrobiota bacterium]